MQEKIEYWLVFAVARTLGRMPRRLARWLAAGLALIVYHLLGRLRRVGFRNLELAQPDLSPKERKAILHGVYRHLGWQLVEFCRMPHYTAQNTKDWIRTE